MRHSQSSHFFPQRLRNVDQQVFSGISFSLRKTHLAKLAAFHLQQMHIATRCPRESDAGLTLKVVKKLLKADDSLG